MYVKPFTPFLTQASSQQMASVIIYHAKPEPLTREPPVGIISHLVTSFQPQAPNCWEMEKRTQTPTRRFQSDGIPPMLMTQDGLALSPVCSNRSTFPSLCLTAKMKNTDWGWGRTSSSSYPESKQPMRTQCHHSGKPDNFVGRTFGSLCH